MYLIKTRGIEIKNKIRKNIIKMYDFIFEML